MVRWGLILLAASLLLIVFGFQTLRDGIAFQKVRVMTCDEFVRNPPQEGWYRLSGCILSVAEAGYLVRKEQNSSGRGDIGQAYVPVYSFEQGDRRARAAKAGLPDHERVGLVLATSDPAIHNTLEQLRNLEGEKEASRLEFMRRHKDDLVVRRDLEGMVLSGVNGFDQGKREMPRLADNLNPKFAVLEAGWKPNLGGGLLQFFGGLLLGVITLFWLVTSYRRNSLSL